MTKIFSLLLILMLAATGFLGYKVESLESENESLSATVTQLKDDTDSKLQTMGKTLDELNGKLAGGEAGQPHTAAAAAPDAGNAPATPPVVVSQPAPAAAPATTATTTPAPAAPAPAAAAGQPQAATPDAAVAPVATPVGTPSETPAPTAGGNK